jgi:uncharacterized YccA/Bax inhibitor family protein
MRTHLEAWSGNHAFSADTFAGTRSLGRDDVLTIEAQQGGISLVILLAAATWTWNMGLADPRIGLLMLGAIGGFVTALIHALPAGLGAVHDAGVCRHRRVRPGALNVARC